MMDNWLMFQLAVDAALLVAVALLALREGKPQPAEMENRPPASQGVNPVEVEVLIEELGKLVARAEMAADRIEKGLAPTGAVAPSVPIKPPSSPLTRNAPADSGSVFDDETYVKAARLVKKGLADEEVGRKVGLPPHEVSLIRKMMT